MGCHRRYGAGAVAGIVAVPSSHDVGITLVVVAVGSMLAAALVLVLSDPTKARAAVVQGGFPLICLLDLGVRALR